MRQQKGKVWKGQLEIIIGKKAARKLGNGIFSNGRKGNNKIGNRNRQRGLAYVSLAGPKGRWLDWKLSTIAVDFLTRSTMDHECAVQRCSVEILVIGVESSPFLIFSISIFFTCRKLEPSVQNVEHFWTYFTLMCVSDSPLPPVDSNRAMMFVWRVAEY